MKKLKLLLVFALYMALILVVPKLIPDNGVNAAWDRIEKRNTERYEKMLKAEGKNVLNKETLEEDHKDCVENYKDNVKIRKHTFIEVTFIMIFTTILIWYCMRLQYPNQLIKSFVYVGVFFIIGMILIAGASHVDDKYLDEPYKYVEENIKIKKDSSSDYILCTDDGRELQVEKHLYERVDEMGKYYLGETKSGYVFSLYPANRFSLENK